MSQRLPQAPLTYDHGDMVAILQVIEQRLADVERILAEGYAITNGTTQRTLDVATATLPDVAQVLGTLVADLKIAGRLG